MTDANAAVASLTAWAAAAPPDEPRVWELGNDAGGQVCVRLRWWRHCQPSRIMQRAATVHEAVLAAMEEWDRTPTCGRR